jgi:hypothetical protein
MAIAGICELVLEADDVGRLQGCCASWGSRSKALLFEDGDGAEEGVMALAEEGNGA